MFDPIRTRRLLIRPARPDDAEALAARRSDPSVARFQSWSTPFPIERARDLLADAGRTTGPVVDQWWMLTITDLTDSTIYGDIALHLENEGHTAEIGYTLGSSHWGKGYATEAVTGLLVRLFDDTTFARVQARIDPENLASAVVLERNGFVFEGRTRQSHWIGGGAKDDVYYGLTRADWQAWCNRPTGRPERVELIELTPDNYLAAGRLRTHWSQQRFVATMEDSFADWLFPETIDGASVTPWGRGVIADGEWAGFVLLALADANQPETMLWRLLVDRLHQRRGIGRRIVELVIDELRRHGESTLTTSWVEGVGSPRPFYLGLGFTENGELIDGETVGRLPLD